MRTESGLLKVFALFALPLALIISLFCSNVQIENSAAQTSSDSSIENYDDYIDYFRANQDEDINSSIVLIYDALVENIYQIKTGSFEFSLRSYNGFDSLAKLSESEQYRAWLGAINALKYDDPTLFFIDFTQIDYDYSIFRNNVVISSDNCYIEGIYNQYQLEQMLNELEEKRTEIYLMMDENWTDYQKVYFVNEYLVENVEYDQTLSGVFVHTVYGSIVDGLAVCDGYSYGVQYLLDGLGITNLVCAGEAYNPSTGASEGHMWSYVKLYDHWYGLDTTWNDPIYYWHPSQEQIEQWKVAYFLKGWDEESGEGFYHMPDDEEERVVQNYQIYYDTERWGDIVYELPVPQIEQNDYTDPSATVETEKSIQSGIATSLIVKLENVENMLDNMTFAYQYSSDGGTNWSDFEQFDQTQIAFDSSEQNGLYQFYIITTNGQVVAKIGESVSVEIGQLYTIEIDAPEGVQIVLSPEKAGYTQNEHIALTINSLPAGMEIESISADNSDVQFIKSEETENVYYFSVPSSNLKISISLQEKLYNVYIEEIEGLSYTLTTPNGQSSAYYGEEVSLTINSLPTGKELASVEGIETADQIEIGTPIKFIMPAEDVNITFALTDIVYKISVDNQEQLSLDYSTSGVYRQEIIISATNLPDNQKLVLSGVEEEGITYLSNDQISFIMPAQDVVVEVSTQELESHAITVQDSAVEVVPDQEAAYFGQNVNLALSYSLQEYRIVNVFVNGVQANRISDFEYNFVMPDENVLIEIETFKIPNIMITNENIDTSLQFVENAGQFYYIITVVSLPEGQYIRSWQAVDETGQSTNAITRLDSRRFQVLLEESDLTITFQLAEQGVLYEDDDPPQETDFLVTTLIFVGVVAILGVICYAVIKKRD